MEEEAPAHLPGRSSRRDRARIAGLVGVVLLALLVAVPSMPTWASEPTRAPVWALSAVVGPGSFHLRAPVGSGDPEVPFVASPAVAREFNHRTTVTALAARDGSAFGYPTSAAGLAYAPWDRSFYVAAPPSSLDQVNATTGQVVTVISVGSNPYGVAIAPSAHLVLVTNSGSDNVSIVSGTTQIPIASVTVGTDPQGIAVDSANGTAFVANNGSRNVSVIGIGARSVVATIGVGTGPTGVAWDPRTNRTFVANYGSDSVSVLSSSAQRLVGTAPAGRGPEGLAVDPATDDVYVANQASNNLTVFAAGSSTLVASVPILAEWPTRLQSVAYDSAHHAIWVAGGLTAIAINTTTETAVDYVFFDPSGIAYDPDDGDVCVTNSANSTFACFVFGGAELVWMPTITFAEAGLPSGVSWQVTAAPSGGGAAMSVTQGSPTPRIVFGIGTDYGWYNISFAIPDVGPYVPYVASSWVWHGHGPGANQTVPVEFYGPGIYPVTFNETGLPAGTNWSVTLGSATLSTVLDQLSFLEPNGTYAFGVGSAIGELPSPSGGTVQVDGRSVTVLVRYGPAPAYPLTFVETGLPAGTLWLVTVDGYAQASTANSTTFYEPNGSYGYSVQRFESWATPTYSGIVTIEGAPVVVAVPWHAIVTYLVTFEEFGLPDGTRWNVSLPGSVTPYLNGSSRTNTINFSEPGGTYSYFANASGGYQVEPVNGVVYVDGGPVTVWVNFTVSSSHGYWVEFDETGLPWHTLWSLWFDGENLYTNGPGFDMLEPNGSYYFEVGVVAGYEVVPARGNVTVAGKDPPPVLLQFLPTSTLWIFNVTFSETGLPEGTFWGVSVAGELRSSTTPTLTLALPNGSYAFTVLPVAGYESQGSTSFTVAGAPLEVPVEFGAPVYPVFIEEVGLPNGTVWSVTVSSSDGETTEGSWSTAPSVELDLPNGTYWVSASASGYTASLSTANFTVSGGLVGLVPVVQFQATPGSGLFGGSAPSLADGVALAASIVAVALAAIALYRTRRDPRRPAP
jgi:YVTN family beta-propeller protein